MKNNKDTEPAVSMKFHVDKKNYNNFIESFARVTGMEKPLDALKGMTSDSGEYIMVFAIPMGDSLHESTDLLFRIVFRMYDYYPAISEKPSEKYMETALAFKQSLIPTRRLVNA